jgi:hypothetical protein
MPVEKPEEQSEAKPLLSKLFFLDTQTYVARNFNFDSGVLKTLQNHLDEDDCHLLITDVNVREVRRHLSRKATEAVAVIKAAQKNAMVLRNTPGLPWNGIFEKVTVKQIEFDLLNNFEKFLNNPRIETVPVSRVNIEEVFDAYFNEQPPFATSGKKSEFPDAFILSAVNNISRDRGYKLYVVSEDRDVKSYCHAHDNLLSIGRLDELLELILKNNQKLAEPAKFAEEVFEQLKDEVRRHLTELLKEAEFDLDESEAEINGIDIEKIEFLSRNLSDVAKEYAVFNVITKISLLIDFFVPDYDRSPWDSEDKYFPFLLQNRIARRYTYSGPVFVNFEYDDGIAANAHLMEIDITDVTNLSRASIEEIFYRELDLSDDKEYEEHDDVSGK